MSAYDVFLADCPARTTLEVVGSTWAVVVVVALGERPRRYSELRDRIGGVSNKMLTQTLRRLEHHGLVERGPAGRGKAPPGPPGPGARVYRLTALGASLLEPVAALSRWAEEHTPALLAARHAHDPHDDDPDDDGVQQDDGVREPQRPPPGH